MREICFIVYLMSYFWKLVDIVIKISWIYRISKASSCQFFSFFGYEFFKWNLKLKKHLVFTFIQKKNNTVSLRCWWRFFKPINSSVKATLVITNYITFQYFFCACVFIFYLNVCVYIPFCVMLLYACIFCYGVVFLCVSLNCYTVFHWVNVTISHFPFF